MAIITNLIIGGILGYSYSKKKFLRDCRYEIIGHVFALEFYYVPMLKRLGEWDLMKDSEYFLEHNNDLKKYYGVLDVEGRANYYGSK